MLHERKYVLLLGGRVALYALLRALDLKPDDEVLLQYSLVWRSEPRIIGHQEEEVLKW